MGDLGLDLLGDLLQRKCYLNCLGGLRRWTKEKWLF
jgi:hypothetical protein